MAATMTVTVSNDANLVSSKAALSRCTRPRARLNVAPRRRPSALLALTQALPKTWAPRSLPIAAVPKVDFRNVVEAAPVCAGLSLDHVLERTASDEMKSRYIQGLSREEARRMEEKVSAISDDAFEPTHLLQVTDGQGGQPLLFPCHGIVMASHFASLGPIPAVPAPRPEGTQHLVDIAVPYPTAFGILRDYAYTHSVDGLMTSLLPLDKSRLPKNGRSATVDVTARAFATSLTGEELVGRAFVIHAAYANAVHLGFNNTHFWRCIHLAWAIITRALQVWKQSQKA